MGQITEMKVFLDVVRIGSFSGVARERKLSQPTVSKRIAALEDRLGARLLQRSTRRVVLTDAGSHYHALCERIVAEIEAADASVGALRAVPRGLLRVTAPVILGRTQIVPHLAQFLAEYPEVNVDLEMTERRIDLFSERFDVALRVGPLADSSLTVRKVGTMRRMTVATPDYLKRRGRPRVPQDLERHDLLTLTPHMLASEHVFASEPEAVSVRVAGRVRLNNIEAIRDLALAGVGIAILPTFLVGHDIQRGTLRAVLRKHEPVPQDINLVYPSKRHLPANARVFMDFIAKKFRQVPQLR